MLYYHGTRYYATWLGNWITADPAGIAGGLNLYMYSMNCPVRFVDPGGQQPEESSGDNESWYARYIREAGIRGAQTVKGYLLRKEVEKRIRFIEEGEDYINFDAMAAAGMSVDRAVENVEQTFSYERHRRDYNARLNRWANRSRGLGSMAFALLEAIVACPLAESGLGAAGCAHAADSMTAGGSQLLSGNPTPTITHQGIKAAAGTVLSESAAEKVAMYMEMAFSMFITMKASMPSGAPKPPAAVPSRGAAAGGEVPTVVEIGAGDLKASIAIAKQGGAKIIAVDPAMPAASAVAELESFGGTFVKGTAEALEAGSAHHVFQYFPWRIGGTGSYVTGGTWRLIQDTVRLLKPTGAAHFVTEDLATAQFLAKESSLHGLRTVITETTAGAAARGASGAGVPNFSTAQKVWMVNIYK
jgi:hypothetical protein